MTNQAPTIDLNVFAEINAAEKSITAFKGTAKENSEAANERKVAAYSVLIAALASNKLIKGNLPRAVSNQVRKGLLENAGLKEATAKRYLENSVGALREFNIPTQATPSLVADILASENVKSENQLAKRVSGEDEKDSLRALAEKLVGRFTTRKNEAGERVQGVFKPTDFVEADFERFENIVRELKAARAASQDAAAMAEAKIAAQNAEFGEVMDKMEVA
jgi:hypothetical protein